MNNRKYLSILFMIASIFILSACSRTLQPDPGTEGVLAFIPPTKVIPTITPTATKLPESVSTPTVAGECQDNLTFINDATIPDGTTIEPGASIDKRWEVQNSGTCNWIEGYTIQLIGGSDMGVDSPLDLIPVRSNSSTTIRIQFFAPKDPGNYRSAWQAFNAEGIAFGDAFYIDIIIKE